MHSLVIARVSTVLLAATIGFGCDDGGDDTTDGDGDGTTIDGGNGAVDAAPAGDAFVPPQGSFSVNWGPVSIPPCGETTQCGTVKLANPAQIRVGKIHNSLMGGSHHLFVYRVNTGTENTTPVDCQPFADTLDPAKGSPLMITQVHEETLQLPAGVAFTLAPDQLIRLEMHFYNPGDAPLDVSATSTFIPMPEAQFENEADFMFVGTIDIDLPAGQAKTIGPKYFPIPAAFASSKFFAITGHTHQMGLNVKVATATGAGDPGTPIYDHQDWLWNEPETTYFDPGFSLPAGGGWKFTCDYNNTSNQSVGFGEGVNDEMCFFWAYYYPSQGSRVCFNTSQAGGQNVCCPGSPICSLIQF